jgi:ABC-type Zn uptake system ZnuABC Zn-binding protein ZnuA
MENFEELKRVVESINDDVTKFDEKGNKSAGTRVRQAMQQLKKLAQEIRVEISAAKKA